MNPFCRLPVFRKAEPQTDDASKNAERSANTRALEYITHTYHRQRKMREKKKQKEENKIRTKTNKTTIKEARGREERERTSAMERVNYYCYSHWRHCSFRLLPPRHCRFGPAEVRVLAHVAAAAAGCNCFPLWLQCRQPHHDSSSNYPSTLAVMLPKPEPKDLHLPNLSGLYNKKK